MASARVLVDGAWLAFAAEVTPADVRQQVGGVGMVIPYQPGRTGQPDRNAAVPARTSLGGGEYEFVRMGGGSQPPPPPPPPPPKVLRATPDTAPPARHQLIREVMGVVIEGEDRPSPAGLPPLANALAQPHFSLHAYLAQTREQRMLYLHRHGVMVVPGRRDEVDFASAEVLHVDKARLVGCAAAGLAEHCVHGDPKWSADAFRIAPVDVWLICRTDLIRAGFTRVGGRIGNDSDAMHEWERLSEADRDPGSRIPEAWDKVTFREWLAGPTSAATAPPAPAGRRPDGPATTTVAPSRQCRFGGGVAVVFGQQILPSTTFVLDWPYGGRNGWSEVVDPIGVSRPAAALISIPPLIEPLTTAPDAKVFLMAAEKPGARGRGDAQFTYVFGDEEREVAQSATAALLLQLDNYEACPLDAAPASPILCGKVLSSAVPAVAAGLSDDALLVHLEARKERGILYSLLAFVDTSGRSLLHYVCRLGWVRTFDFCVKEGGAACLGVPDGWGFLPLHFSVASQDLSFITHVVEEMTPRERDAASRKTADGSSIYDIAADRAMEDALEDLLQPKLPEREATPELDPPKKKRKKKHAWDQSKGDVDVDISTVDDSGAIVL